MSGGASNAPEQDDDLDGCDCVEHADPSEATSDEDLPASQGGVAPK